MGSITFYTFMFEDVGTKLSSLRAAVEIVTKSMLFYGFYHILHLYV